MHETYPVNKEYSSKNPASLGSKTIADENFFEGTLSDWEERVFRNASCFTVVRYNNTGSERIDVETFPRAIALAGNNSRALVYAVTNSGRSFCVPRSEWLKYYDIWVGR